MKLSKRILKLAEKLDAEQTKGKDLNRKQRRLLAAAEKKLG